MKIIELEYVILIITVFILILNIILKIFYVKVYCSILRFLPGSRTAMDGIFPGPNVSLLVRFVGPALFGMSVRLLSLKLRTCFSFLIVL
jgi:hypothetical protein